MIPVIEEILYLTCLYSLSIELNLPIFIFTILSSVGFGLCHFRYPKINVFTKMLWGLIFALFYLKTKSLYVPIIIHILNNGIILFISNRTNGKDIL